MPLSDEFLVIIPLVAALASGTGLFLLLRNWRWRQRAAAQALLAYGALLGLLVAVSILVLHIHSMSVPFPHIHWSPFPFVHWHGAFGVELHVHDVGFSLNEACCLGAGIVAIGAGLVTPFAAFVSSQVALRSMRRRMLRHIDVAATRRLRELSGLTGTSLFAVDWPGLDALAFTILRWRRTENTILVSQKLVRGLPTAELAATVAHEVGHLRSFDGRYFPFIQALQRLVFFDPLLRMVVRRIEREKEFEADAFAARSTGRPLAVARALVAAHAESGCRPKAAVRKARWRRAMPGAAAHGIRGGRALLEERVERLVEMQEEIERQLDSLA